MKRLLDETARSEGTQHEDVLDALKRTDVDPFMEQRVLARVRSARSGKLPVRRGRLRPAGVLAALVVLVLASAASAMFWRAMKQRHNQPAPEATAPVRPIRPVASPAPVEQPFVPERAVEPAGPVATGKPEPKHTAPRMEPTGLQDRKAETPAPAESTETAESQLLLDAYRSMRTAHDAAAALAKVDTYLTLYPRGKLAEEALTLALEATANDPALAAPYARRYLARFPDGAKAKLAADQLEKAE